MARYNLHCLITVALLGNIAVLVINMLLTRDKNMGLHGTAAGMTSMRYNAQSSLISSRDMDMDTGMTVNRSDRSTLLSEASIKRKSTSSKQKPRKKSW